MACETAPLARHATRIRTISSSPSCLPPSRPFRGFSPPLSNSRRATGHDAAIVLNTVCESASYTVAPPRPHSRRQTDTSHSAAVAPQTTWVSFFFPFSNRRRTTAATSSRASQLLPPSRLASRTHLHLTCRSGEPFACTQATPLPPSCGTWPHLQTFSSVFFFFFFSYFPSHLERVRIKATSSSPPPVHAGHPDPPPSHHSRRHLDIATPVPTLPRAHPPRHHYNPRHPTRRTRPHLPQAPRVRSRYSRCHSTSPPLPSPCCKSTDPDPDATSTSPLPPSLRRRRNRLHLDSTTTAPTLPASHPPRCCLDTIAPAPCSKRTTPAPTLPRSPSLLLYSSCMYFY